MMIEPVKKYLLDLQNRICQFLEKEEGGAKFHEDRWQHHDSFGGITRVLTGLVIEKAGVNFSHVSAPSLPEAATLKRPELASAPFEALGVSVVIHPFNPYAPTCHMNVRCIIVKRENDEPIWWFGGGFDMTPYYGFVEDCIHFHSEAKAACLPFGEEVYPKYKKWADQYFFLKHRQEPRGIGGIFFDDLNAWGFERSYAFMQSVGNHFISAYQPILHRRKTHEFAKREKDFQLLRRGRYVEFNLLYDRGTLFGLQSGGRTESILMSLPPLVAWQYANESSPNTDQADLIEKFLKPRDWCQ